MNDYGDLAIMIRQLRTELEWAAKTGIVPPAVASEPETEPEIVHAPAPMPVAQAPIPPPDPPPLFQPKAGLTILDKCGSLEEVREVLGDCKRCKLGGLGRRQVVFGVGNPAADIMFIGEGPGADEDIQGEPFVGKAGQLLTKIIEAGMGMKRSDVYIANVVKCRPPQNRDPEPDEIETCRPFLESQIRLVGPKVIVTLGRFAAQTLLNTTTGMMRLRGKWTDYHGVPVMPTFHPAYLLRNPADKRATWEDIQEVLRFLGRPIPKRG
jgi:uracil-DNA glycosylase